MRLQRVGKAGLCWGEDCPIHLYGLLTLRLFLMNVCLSLLLTGALRIIFNRYTLQLRSQQQGQGPPTGHSLISEKTCQRVKYLEAAGGSGLRKSIFLTIVPRCTQCKSCGGRGGKGSFILPHLLGSSRFWCHLGVPLPLAVN